MHTAGRLPKKVGGEGEGAKAGRYFQGSQAVEAGRIRDVDARNVTDLMMCPSKTIYLVHSFGNIDAGPKS